MLRALSTFVVVVHATPVDLDRHPSRLRSAICPVDQIDFGQHLGTNIYYALIGVVYAGGAHFSARWRDASGKWWTYDGMVNSGQPSLDPITNDAQLTSMGPRVMHILLYRLGTTDFTGYS